MGYIYKIKNIINNNIYIGSTSNIKNRKKHHFTRLKANKHCNIHLQRSWNKYGKDSFKFEVIENNIEDNKLIEREQYYIDNLKPSYNMQKIAGGSALGLKRSKQTCLNISNSLKGKKLTKEHRLKISIGRKGKYLGRENKISKPIIQYDMNNNFIKEYESINMASIENNIIRTGINNCLNNRSKSSGGFIWKYKEVVNG